MPGSVTSPTSGGTQLTLTPSTAGTETVSLETFDSQGGVGSTSESVTVFSPASITGLPSGNITAGTPVTLNASPRDRQRRLQLPLASDGFASHSSTGSQALSFNGTNQFVDLGNPTDLNFSGQITLEAWIKPESTTGLQDIIAHGYQVSPNQAEDFLRISNGYYQVGSWNGSTAMAQAPIPAGDVGQWVHLAGSL